jgi:AAA domain
LDADTLLVRLECQKASCECHRSRERGRGLTHCPSHHNVRTPALSISTAPDGMVLVHCHNGCEQNEIIAALRELGLWSSESKMEENAERQLLRETRYEIRDSEGNLKAVHTRLDYTSGPKRMAWPVGTRVNELPFYGSERLGEWSSVVIVEGEKSADALRSVGVPALATFGTSYVPSVEVLRTLRDKKIWLWPDAAPDGYGHMGQLGFLLRDIAASVQWVAWTDAPAKGDAADFVAAGNGKDEVKRLLAAATPWGASDGERSTGADTLEAPRTEPVSHLERGIATVKWPSMAIEMEFSRLRSTKDGEPLCDVAVNLAIPGLPARLHRAQFWLNSTPARKALAEFLKNRTKALGLDWLELLEVACGEVLTLIDVDEKPVYLDDVVASSDERYLLEPFVLRDLPSVIFGDGGSGKSYFALALAASLQSGRPFLGIAPKETVRVAYLDWELNPQEHRARAQMLAGNDRLGLLYVPCGRRRLRDQVQKLQRIFDEHSIQFAIIDSVGFACGGDLNDAQVALDYFEALKQLQVGTLSIGHVNKSGDTGKVFGSSYFHFGFRLAWYVERAEESTDEKLEMGFFNRKSNTSQKAHNIGFRFTFGPSQVKITKFDVRDSTSLLDNLGLETRMKKALVGGSKSLAELSAQLKASVAEVEQVAKRAPAVFVRVQAADGSWKVGLSTLGYAGIERPTRKPGLRVVDPDADMGLAGF